MSIPTIDPGEARDGSGDPARGLAPTGLERRLYREGYVFDFFQAVRLLQRRRGSVRVGEAGPPSAEAVRFRTHVSLGFPPSTIHEVIRPAPQAPPILVHAFLGLIGPSGVLPHHYTEIAYRLERDRSSQNPEKLALRDWLDVFNHRLVSLFYRAWEKYRFHIPFERERTAGRPSRGELDLFTAGLFSLVGQREAGSRGRIRVAVRLPGEHEAGEAERPLARVEDIALLRFSGLFANRIRSAVGLQAILQDYFRIPVEIRQFQGQWLAIEPANRTRLEPDGNNQLGFSAVIGDRVWDIQSRFRLRIGPLTYDRFLDLLPDRSPVEERKTLFLLTQVVRLYVGAELDFDHQLVLRRSEVPDCRLEEGAGFGARLGWNTWLHGLPLDRDPDDAVFFGEEVIHLGESS
ncbi:type VI secretion system baseplate subunit TssG [Aquisphaera insulae]|uniref:type VI secretion system baseplate subunit TssG n=1 Tax=Aquisphaera insulae TaxID=2712864 RepID=UPI0013EAE2E0|nr:type VI secretion system baseplate subunit TssG [Aquisphaera insulae]